MPNFFNNFRTSNHQSIKNPSPPPILYKFNSSPPQTPEKSTTSKMFSFKKKSPEPKTKTQIWPPPQKLRTASSMVSLDTIPNGNALQNKNKLSQSTYHLNGEILSNGVHENGDGSGSSSKLKRKKWYSMFLPPKEPKINTKIVEEETFTEKEKKPKRHWFTGKKSKRDKAKIAVAI